MTRLTSADLQNISPNWTQYERNLVQMLKLNDLISLAALAVDRPAEEVRSALQGRRLAAVSISKGEGILSSFAQSVACIGSYLGMESKIMESPDDEGLSQAEGWGADIIIYADDDQYLARNVRDGQVADNNPATSRVYVAALERLSSSSLKGQEVLVLGLGIIGQGAAARLIELGASPLIYDPDPGKKQVALEVIAQGKGELIPDQIALAKATRRTNLIFDATPIYTALPPDIWPSSPVVAAPGVPLSWPLTWLQPGAAGRLWHDPLESGTAAMLAYLA